MIILDLYNFVKDFEIVRFDPDSTRPRFIGLKTGDASTGKTGWTIIQIEYHGPSSIGIKDIQKKTGIYDNRERLFTKLEKPKRNLNAVAVPGPI